MVVTPDVRVYDPNTLNPYGAELASLLAEAGDAVTYFGPSVPETTVGRGVSARRVLAPARGAAASPVIVVRRLTGPLRAAIGRPSTPLVVCWVRDPWDALVFLLRVLFGGRTIVVYHNPQSIRARGGLAGRLERELVRRTRTIVHGEWLRPAAEEVSGEVVVASHPPYAVSVGEPAPRRAEPAVFGFVGAMREDKGAGEIPVIASATTTPWTLRVLGPDRFTEETERRLVESGVTVEYPGDGALDDEALAREIRRLNAVLAPYRQVTYSGSVGLALSLGVPVLALESEATSAIVGSRSTCSDAAEMARRIDGLNRGVDRLDDPVRDPGLDASIRGEWRSAVHG